MALPKFSVHVGNVGLVCNTFSEQQAREEFNLWVVDVTMGHGRHVGEAVTMFKDDDIIDEYFPDNFDPEFEGEN